MGNSILDRGRNISESYYANNVFFRQLILLSQSVVEILLDKNMNVKQMGYGKQFSLISFSWLYDQGFMLPKSFWIQFLPKTEGTEKFEASNTHYLWYLRFFPFNPKDKACWIPFGFLARVEMKENGPLPNEAWDKIADTLRPIVFNHDLESVYQVFGIDVWPHALQGKGGSDDFSKIVTVPFPLAAISTSEDLSEWIEKSLSALNGKDDDLLKDSDFILKYWGIVR